VQSQDIA
jgi:suppressor of G2 allele of SKP1